jgi:membrane-associated phospholipid phosphatase
MKQPEELAAWRLFCCNWAVLGLMTVALAISMPLTGFSIAPISALKPLAIIGPYIGCAYYNYYRPHRFDPKIIFILGSTGQILLIPVLMTPLTYIAASANLPMQDVALNALDRALGLDWLSYFNFVYRHHALLVASVLAYSMIGWPLFGVPIALGWTGRYQRLQEFTLAFAIALIVTTIISTFVPAMGAYDLLHVHTDPNIFTPGAYVDYLQVMPHVRDGSLRVLAFSDLIGIVTFPSFHAAAAALYLWAFWPVRWIGPIAVVTNVAMLLATLVVGGHYFVDVFAGIAVATASIMSAKRIAAWLIRPTQSARNYRTATAVPAE